MPTLKELQDNHAAAVVAYNDAVAAQTSAETVMNSAHAAMSRCVCGKGKHLGKCRPLPSSVVLGLVELLSWRIVD